MSTILKLLNADFQNPNLPVYLPITKDRIVEAYTFNNGLKVISGSAPTPTGAVEYDSEGVTLTAVNGTFQSNFISRDAGDYTIIMVAKKIESGVTNSHFTANDRNDMATVYAGTGSASITAQDRDPAFSAPVVRVSSSSAPFDTTEYFFFSFSSTLGGVSFKVPGANYEGSASATTPLTGAPNPTTIGPSTSDTSSAKVKICAAAIYNKVLTDDEIAQNHEALKSYLKGSSSIDIV